MQGHTLEEMIGDIAAVRRRKRALLGLIAATSVAPLLFIDLREPSTSLVIYKIIAKTGSLVGTLLLVWQFLLGFRGVVSSIVLDLVWVINLHKQLGKAATILIILHPVFITPYYLEKFGRNVLRIDAGSTFGLFVILGMIAFLFLGIIFVTSVNLRRRLRTGWWYFIHLSSYVLLPLVFIHSFAIGMTVTATPLRYPWAGLSLLMVIFYMFRMLFRLGLFSSWYRIVRTRPVADRVVDVTMSPIAAQSVCPSMGQFVYVRRGKLLGARPYTVSGYDATTADLSITAKARGVTSTGLQKAYPGDIVGIDGPYGVFTWEAVRSGRPIIMVAGGIGITPFKRLIGELERGRRRPAWLFYGAERLGDLVYKDELDTAQKVRVVFVLNAEPSFQGEKGLVTTDMIRKYVARDISECEFLLCGPPVMITTLEADLEEAGISPDRIYHELFNW